MQAIKILNQTSPLPFPIESVYCNTFICRFCGLMLKPNIAAYSGLLLVEDSESILNTAIHMLFMRFDIAAIWINSKLQVVDTKLARAWHPLYTSRFPAKYILETHPDRLDDFRPNDQLIFENA